MLSGHHSDKTYSEDLLYALMKASNPAGQQFF